MRTVTVMAAAVILVGCTDWRAQVDTQLHPPVVEYASGPGPYDFDCDSRAGEPMQLNIRAPGAMLRVTGTLRFEQVDARLIWLPVAGIGFVQPDHQQDIGLAAWVDNDEITRFAFGHSMDVVSVPGARLPGAEKVFTGQPIPFVLTIGQSGKASASIDNIVVGPARIVPGLERIRLSCSTAHVQFSNVRVETL